MSREMRVIIQFQLWNRCEKSGRMRVGKRSMRKYERRPPSGISLIQQKYFQQKVGKNMLLQLVDYAFFCTDDMLVTVFVTYCVDVEYYRQCINIHNFCSIHTYTRLIFSSRASLFCFGNSLASAVATAILALYFSPPLWECVAIYWLGCCPYFPPVKSNWKTIACTRALLAELAPWIAKTVWPYKEFSCFFPSFNSAPKTLILWWLLFHRDSCTHVRLARFDYRVMDWPHTSSLLVVFLPMRRDVRNRRVQIARFSMNEFKLGFKCDK